MEETIMQQHLFNTLHALGFIALHDDMNQIESAYEDDRLIQNVLLYSDTAPGANSHLLVTLACYDLPDTLQTVAMVKEAIRKDRKGCEGTGKECANFAL